GISGNKIEGRHEPGEASYVRSVLWIGENRPNRPRMAKAGYSGPILWAGADDVWDRSDSGPIGPPPERGLLGLQFGNESFPKRWWPQREGLAQLPACSNCASLLGVSWWRSIHSAPSFARTSRALRC